MKNDLVVFLVYTLYFADRRTRRWCYCARTRKRRGGEKVIVCYNTSWSAMAFGGGTLGMQDARRTQEQKRKKQTGGWNNKYYQFSI